MQESATLAHLITTTCFLWCKRLGCLQVKRHGNKWKVQLKQGIVNIDGREYVFGKANGDFIF